MTKEERSAKWRAENPEKVREYCRKWRENNRAKAREACRKSRKKNPGYARKWVAANREKTTRYKKKWRLANPEKVRAYRRAHRLANVEQMRLRERTWKRANPDKLRQYQKNQWRKLGMPEPTRAKPSLCECCSKSPGVKGLHLDHCHKSGKFRGWLCSKCNLGVGSLGDSIAGVARMLRYLKRDKGAS